MLAPVLLRWPWLGQVQGVALPVGLFVEPVH